MDGSHVEWMRLALHEAQQALALDEVPVGCVFLDGEGRVVGRGHNETNRRRDPSAHAELVAWRGMDDEARRQARHLAVTIEPCLMCAAALRRLSGPLVLHSVVFGARNERFGGCGTVENVLMRPQKTSWTGGCGPDNGPPESLVEGVMADEAVAILKRFYATENTRWAPEEKRRKKDA